MTPTLQIYLENFSLLDCDATVIKVMNENESDLVITDRTVFYPQGGGQPYDRGIIESPLAKFIVEEVRLMDDVVRHIGKFEKNIFKEGENVICHVDAARRSLNSRIHSAGHVVDLAVQELKLGWIPGKGYHFPQGPYVEYSGSLEGLDKEALKAEIETLCNKFISEGKETQLLFVEREKLESLCHFIPNYIPQNKPIRVIMFGDFAVPCGGTHVKNLVELKSMTIRKVKTERGNIRVSYDVAR